MKQTLEEAANDYLQKILEASDFEINFEEDNYDAGARDAVLDVTERTYIAGAEWQAKQSPWSLVSDMSAPMSGDRIYLLLLEDGSVVDDRTNWHESGLKVIAFMPIPSFDQILESNKDVLQRMKGY